MNCSDQDRQKLAKKILESPAEYKVCEGCGSILALRAHTCPSCHAYRFNIEAKKVITQAKRLASRRSQSVIANDLI